MGLAAARVWWACVQTDCPTSEHVQIGAFKVVSEAGIASGL